MATTLSGLENQTKVITMNALGEYDNLRPQVKPVEATHAQMVAMRDQGKLIPGQLYRITDYVTTTMQENTRSAGHPFDIIVMALDATTLSENAWAIQHDGDEYFANSNLAAWKLRYNLDNIQWSAVAGTYAVEENDGYSLTLDGTVEIEDTTYLLWKAESGLYDDYNVTYAVSEDAEVGTELLEYDPESGEIIPNGWSCPIESVSTIENSGSGTITWMKDEFGNECPYDFKNIQFKRWKVTDSMEGRTGFTDTYLGVLNHTPANLTIEDDDDFIWAYTFSSDASGGNQTDTSIDSLSDVYSNVIKEMYYGTLPNNVLFGTGCHNNSFSQNCDNNSFSQNCPCNSFSQNCGDNSFLENCSDNSFSRNCSRNSFSNNCSGNSFMEGCINNSFSQNCTGNSFSQDCTGNSFSNNCTDTSFSQGCSDNSFSNNCLKNSFSQNCFSNSFSNDCNSNSFSQDVHHVKLSNVYMREIMIESGNEHLNVICSQTTSPVNPCKNVKIEQGVGNSTTEKTITITTRNQNYQTVVKNANSVEITA